MIFAASIASAVYSVPSLPTKPTQARINPCSRYSPSFGVRLPESWRRKSIMSVQQGKGSSSNHTVEEAYQFLGISPNKDGSLTREIRVPMVDATPSINQTDPPIALSKDIYVDPSSMASCLIRLFRPIKPPENTKIPLVIYFHGGDFVLFSVTSIIFHNFCNEIASQIPAIVASVEYRLAPEHRLPAAYDDAISAILWAKNQALGINGRDPWLENVDFSRVFLLGSASGGNIAYNVALRAMDFELEPMKIKGLIMNQPFFSGVERTESELRLIDDSHIPLYVLDVLWTLALPKHANRDHEFCNPLSLGSFGGRVERLPKCMMKGNTGDPLVDRGTKLAKFLETCGVIVDNVLVEGGYHAIELDDANAGQDLYELIKNFINST